MQDHGKEYCENPGTGREERGQVVQAFLSHGKEFGVLFSCHDEPLNSFSKGMISVRKRLSCMDNGLEGKGENQGRLREKPVWSSR